MPKSTDYLYSAARIRSLETALLNEDRIERILSAKTKEDALKVLLECGYGDIRLSSAEDIDKIINSERKAVFELVDSLSPDKRLTDIAKIRYDYHNIKVIIKSNDKIISDLFINSGRFSPDLLVTAVRENNFSDLPLELKAAITEAVDVLIRTKNPQLTDFLLDSAMFSELSEKAKQTGSEFTQGYVRLLIDINNLRSYIRSLRMKKNVEFFKAAVIKGGSIDAEKLTNAYENGSAKPEAIFSGTLLENAAVLGTASLKEGSSLTLFEKTCDDTLVDYLKKAKYVPFGPEPVFSYLLAKEAELTAVRTLLTGILSNTSTEKLRERLRKTYV